jgi:NAD+ synthase (glutamine-hydrolysing)
MKSFNFFRVAAIAPEIRVADIPFNLGQIQASADRAITCGAELLVFPELSLTGYTCQDLFQQTTLLHQAEAALQGVWDGSCGQKLADSGALILVGLPICHGNGIFNCAALLQAGQTLAIIPKTHIPNYKEFQELRWFTPANLVRMETIRLAGSDIPFGNDLLIRIPNREYARLAVEICEDLWVPIPLSSYSTLAGATLIANLSASNETIGKADYRRSLVINQSGRCIAAYIYSSCGPGESTSDVVFSGHLLISENGALLRESERFKPEGEIIVADIDLEKLEIERLKINSFIQSQGMNAPKFREIQAKPVDLIKLPLERQIDPLPFVPRDQLSLERRCQEIFSIQREGLRKRFVHTGIRKAVIAISGGLDSTLALLILAKTFEMLHFPSADIIAVTMPGFGTTSRTKNNACLLARELDVTLREIPIRELSQQMLSAIGHDGRPNTTYENVQARIRKNITMNIANEEHGLEIGTGDLSEGWLGFCTLIGDHASMYNPNAGIPKTLVRFLVSWLKTTFARPSIKIILDDILATPISPELLAPDQNDRIQQKTEDIIGSYELHDFFIFYLLRYGFSVSKIFELANHAFAGQYRRAEILRVLRINIARAFANQFKRNFVPDAPKVGSISLSPRGDLRLPADAEATIWLDECDKLIREEREKTDENSD